MYVTAVNIKSHMYFFIQIYFGTVFRRVSLGVCERYILKIYNERIAKTNQWNDMMTQ